MAIVEPGPAPPQAPLLFSLDLEDHTERYATHGARYQEITLELLDVLDMLGLRGTAFVVGRVVLTAPWLVRAVAARGHEIACHGLEHRTLAHETPAGFLDGTREAKTALEDVAGTPVLGYRAPMFSLTPRSAWVVPMLAHLGFTYSSSVIPAAHPLHGFRGAPAFRVAAAGRQAPSPRPGWPSRRNAMKILYRYLGAAFLRNMIFCTAGLMVLVALTILFGKIDNALAGWSALALLIFEIGKTLPTVLEIVTPLLVLIATVITITQVGRHFELVSMKFAGLSRLQVMWPMLLCGVLISGLGYANQSYINRWLMDTPGYSSDVPANRHQWRAVGDSVYYLQRIDALRHSIAGVRILRFSQQTYDLTAIDTAQTARKTDHGWQLGDVVARRRAGSLWESSERASVALPSEAFPVVLESKDADLHHAPLEEVVGAILLLQTLGLAHHLQRLELHQKLATLLMPLLMILLATPIAQINSRNERIDVKYVIVVVLGLIYMIGNETLFLLGKGNYLPPAVAVWTSPLLVLALALVLIARSR